MRDRVSFVAVRRLRAPSAVLVFALALSALLVGPAPAATPGAAYGWGRNYNGMLGDGTTTSKSSPVAVSGGLTFVSITGGFFHSIALTAGGDVYAWGTNSSMQLGTGTTSEEIHSPRLVSSLPSGAITQISAYGDHSLALASSGHIYQWGDDFYTARVVTPKDITLPGGVAAVAVSAGETHSLALGSNGTVYAWGNNCYGQIGNGSAVDAGTGCPSAYTAPSPVAISMPVGYTGVAIAAGQWHSAALLRSVATDVVSLWSWGYNSTGQLGNNTTTSSNVPVQALEAGTTVPFTGAEAIEGGDTQTLILKSGNVFYTGSLGAGGSTTGVAQKTGLSGVTQVQAGYANYALLSDGTVKAWGSASSGNLGDGGSTSSATPVSVGGSTPISGVIAIGAADFDAYAIVGSPNLTADPTSLDFGDVAVGSNATLSVTYTNSGSAPVNVAAANLDASSDFSEVSDTCDGATLQVGETCSASIRYTPSDVGSDSGGFYIASNDPSDPVVTLSGNGIESVGSVSNVVLQVVPTNYASPSPDDYTTNIGATEVDVNDVPNAGVPQSTGPTASIPTARIPTARIPTARIPTARIPTARIPTARIPTARIPTARIPTARISSTVFGNSTLNRFPITRPGGWQAILDAYPARFGGDATSENTRFFELYQPTPIAEVDPAAAENVQLKIGEFNLALSPFANVSLAAFLAGSLRWSDVGIDATTLPATCVAPPTGDPSGAVSGQNTMIFEADIRGCPLDQTGFLSKPIGAYAAAASQKAVFPDITVKDSIYYDNSKLDDVLVSSLAAANRGYLVNCAAAGVNCTDASTQKLGDPAIVPNLRTGFEAEPAPAPALPVMGRYRGLGDRLNTFTLADIIEGLVPRTTLPWADFEPLDISVEGYGTAANLKTYQLDFDAPCPAGETTIVLTPHGGFRYKPGSSEIQGGEGFEGFSDPTLGPNGAMTYTLGACTYGSAQHPQMRFKLMPGFTLGDFGVDVDISVADPTPPSPGPEILSVDHVALPSQAIVHVVESDTSNSVSDPSSGSPGILYLGHIAAEGDTDAISFSVPPGKIVSVGLNVPDGHDFDLVLYAPQGSDGGVKNLVPGAPKKANFGKVPVYDAGYFQGGVVRPEVGQEIPIAKGVPVAGVSAFRQSDSEYITTTAVAGNEGAEYVLQINGHNGSHSNIAYTAFVSVGDPVPLPDCSTAGRGFAYTGQASVSPAAPGLPAGNDPADTLIVLDQQRMRDSYGATGYAGVMSQINQFVAAQPGGVKARLLPLDAFGDVNSAFSTLDAGANRCDPEKINDVVRAITGRISTYRGNATNIVMVGSDEIEPFARLVDKTTDGNEAGFAGDLLLDSNPGADVDANNALAGSFGKGYYLSDNPYGTLTPLSVYGDLVYLPQLNVGRIGEQADDIASQFETFRLFAGVADGKTAVGDTRRALETDYDFLIDGGTLMTNELKNQVGAANVTRLSPAVQNHEWDRGELEASLLGGTPPSVVALNAHFSHHEALPASGNNAATPDLFTADRVSAASTPSLLKRIYYSVGCHMALNVDNHLGAGLLPASDLANRTTAFDTSTLNDWTEAFMRKKAAAVIGNLGYGIADVVGVGYTERLMANFAKNLDGSKSLGAGLRDAKTSYWLSMGSFTGEDVKALSQVVLWGFPMYKVPGAIGAAAAVTPVGAISADPISGVASSSQFDLAPTFATNNAPGGRQFVSADNGTQNTAPYPVMPKVLASFPSVSGKKPAFFAPIEVSSFSDQSILQAFSNPTTDSNTDPTVAGNVAYPAVLQNITTAVGLGGTSYNGVIIPATYFPGADFNGPGTLRKFNSSKWMVWYTNEAADPEPPLVESVEATVVGSGTAIVVKAMNTDGDSSNEVSRVYVLVQRAGQSSLQRVELAKGLGNRFSGGLAVTDVIRIDAYAVTKLGAGASATFKGLGYPVSPGPGAPDLPAPKSLAVKEGTLTSSGWYRNSASTGAPKAFVNDGSGGVDTGYDISIDGGAPVSAPAPIVGDGFHTIQAVVHEDGRTVDGAIIVGVDNTAPKVYIHVPVNGSTLLLNQAVAESYTCVDGGSGIAAGGCTDSNPGSNVNTSSIGTKTFDAMATDAVGLTGSASASYTVKFAGLTGFSPPVDAYPLYDSSNKLLVNSATTKQTIPFKWTVKDANGAPVPSAGNGATYAWTAQAASACSGTGTTVDPVPSDYVSVATSAPFYDPGSGNWQWNIKKGTPTGCFMFTLKLADGGTLRALFSIK